MTSPDENDDVHGTDERLHAGAGGRTGVASGDVPSPEDLRRTEPSSKRCFTYCGADRCDCGAWEDILAFAEGRVIPHSQERPPMTSPEPGEMEDVAERVAEFAASLERSPDRLMVYEGDAIAERLRSLLAHLSRQEEESRQAMREALRLAVYLHRRFYSDVPQWKPLNDPAGVLSQVDNMLSGVIERMEAAESALSSLKGAVGRVVEAGKPFAKLGDTRYVLSIQSSRFRALSSALSELESQCSAGAESKRREDAPSSAPGSDGGES